MIASTRACIKIVIAVRTTMTSTCRDVSLRTGLSSLPSSQHNALPMISIVAEMVSISTNLIFSCIDRPSCRCCGTSILLTLQCLKKRIILCACSVAPSEDVMRDHCSADDGCDALSRISSWSTAALRSAGSRQIQLTASRFSISSHLPPQ